MNSRNIGDDFGKLKNLIIADRFMRTLPTDIKDYVRIKEGDTWFPIEQAANLADIYANDHLKSGFYNQRDRGANQSHPGNGDRSNFRNQHMPNRVRSHSPSTHTTPKEVTPSTSDQGNRLGGLRPNFQNNVNRPRPGPVCFNCGRPGHLARSCFRPRVSGQGGSSAANQMRRVNEVVVVPTNETALLGCRKVLEEPAKEINRVFLSFRG